MSNIYSTDEWAVYLGEQCRMLRIRANLEQGELANRANVSVGAVKNLERGKGTALKTLIKIMRALERTDWLEALAPKVSISPIQMLRENRKQASRLKVFRKRRSVCKASDHVPSCRVN